MTERFWPNGCRRLAVVALVAFCLKQGVDGAWAYLGSADAYSYLADWRAAARHAPDGAIALLCGEAGGSARSSAPA